MEKELKASCSPYEFSELATKNFYVYCNSKELGEFDNHWAEVKIIKAHIHIGLWHQPYYDLVFTDAITRKIVRGDISVVEEGSKNAKALSHIIAQYYANSVADSLNMNIGKYILCYWDGIKVRGITSATADDLMYNGKPLSHYMDDYVSNDCWLDWDDVNKDIITLLDYDCLSGAYVYNPYIVCTTMDGKEIKVYFNDETCANDNKPTLVTFDNGDDTTEFIVSVNDTDLCSFDTFEEALGLLRFQLSSLIDDKPKVVTIKDNKGNVVLTN